MRFRRDRCPSPIGGILMISDDDGNVRALDFEDYESRMHQLLRLQWGDYALSEGPAPATAKQAIEAYFEGELDRLATVPIRMGGTAFQRDVWDALRAIPAGTTTSYGRLAANLGRPKASRAVGMANGSNPIAIVVPCHRVIGSDGSLTGYGGGLPRKQWLIRHEREWSDGATAGFVPGTVVAGQIA
ncbi:MAG: methylated-DNA--[protein]-cysteine S-methyltransferase [Acetobacteraceae bacterium]